MQSIPYPTRPAFCRPPYDPHAHPPAALPMTPGVPGHPEGRPAQAEWRHVALLCGAVQCGGRARQETRPATPRSPASLAYLQAACLPACAPAPCSLPPATCGPGASPPSTDPPSPPPVAPHCAALRCAALQTRASASLWATLRAGRARTARPTTLPAQTGEGACTACPAAASGALPCRGLWRA
jgi:hypothetical protein